MHAGTAQISQRAVLFIVKTTILTTASIFVSLDIIEGFRLSPEAVVGRSNVYLAREAACPGVAWLFKRLGGCRNCGKRCFGKVRFCILPFTSWFLFLFAAYGLSAQSRTLITCNLPIVSCFCCRVERFTAAALNPDTLLCHGVRWTCPAVGSGQPYALGETVASR